MMLVLSNAASCAHAAFPHSHGTFRRFERACSEVLTSIFHPFVNVLPKPHHTHDVSTSTICRWCWVPLARSIWVEWTQLLVLNVHQDQPRWDSASFCPPMRCGCAATAKAKSFFEKWWCVRVVATSIFEKWRCFPPKKSCDIRPDALWPSGCTRTL